MWSRQVIWGNHRIKGGVLKPAANAWASNVVWGTLADDQGENIVWGTLCADDCENIVWGTVADELENIVWGTIADGENIVWGTADQGENIVWGTVDLENIVWGTACGGDSCENIVWGTAMDLENIVWGTLDNGENIVWGTTMDLENIVWGTGQRPREHRVGHVGRRGRDLGQQRRGRRAVRRSVGGAGQLRPDAARRSLPATDAATVANAIVADVGTDGHPDHHHGRRTLMEKMPFRDAQEVIDVHAVIATAQKVTTSDWRQALPVLTGTMATLRELRLSDAPALLAMLSTEEVARFISPPPTTVEGFERFIAWTHRERAAGNYTCFAVVPHNMDTAIGIFQVRQLEPGFGTAEWGFAIGSPFWGTGIFLDAAAQVIDFAFDVIGTRRLEARAATANGRGNGALRKVGAVQEGVLRKSFLRDGEYLDQILWTILDDDWRRSRSQWRQTYPLITGVPGGTEAAARTGIPCSLPFSARVFPAMAFDTFRLRPVRSRP